MIAADRDGQYQGGVAWVPSHTGLQLGSVTVITIQDKLSANTRRMQNCQIQDIHICKTE